MNNRVLQGGTGSYEW